MISVSNIRKFHIHNLVGKLRSITYTFYNLKGLVPKQTMDIYFALYQSIFQHGMLVWVGLGDTILNKLQVIQNNTIIICLNKFSLHGYTTQNYQLDSPIKKISILFTTKRFIEGKDYTLLEGKKEKIYCVTYLSTILINRLANIL